MLNFLVITLHATHRLLPEKDNSIGILLLVSSRTVGIVDFQL